MKLPLVTFFFAVTFACATDVSITRDELVRRTQELYDAIVPGNQAPWKKYFADDCIFADEKGRVFDKPKLIADIAPLPKGYSGTIKIENAQSRIIGNSALFSYDADESEMICGSKPESALSRHRHLAAAQRRVADHRQPGASLLRRSRRGK